MAVQNSLQSRSGGKPKFSVAIQSPMYQKLVNDTLENIVKVMLKDTQKGGGAFFGGGEIWGVATKDYGSVAEIRADAGRLGNLPDEEYDAIREKYTQRLADICNEIKDKRERNSFMASDEAASAIVETLRKKRTVAAIDKELRTYTHLNIHDDTAKKVLDLFHDIQNMPTGYFEAKPQRAVGFDEVLAAIIPDDSSEKLRTGLERAGVRMLEYKSGDDTDRLAKVNSVEGARFSLKTDSQGRTLTEQQREYFKDSKAVDDQGRLMVMYHGTRKGGFTKTYNMFVNSVYDLRNAEGKDALKKAKRGLARTTTALVVSFAVNAVMQSIVDALRDDDKERDYWEKMLTAYTGFTGDEETLLDYWNSFWSGNLEANFNPMGYLPYFKDMLSIAQGYDVSRMDMEPVSKVWDAAVNMKKALSGEGKYSLAGASANLLAEAARLLGIPVANLKRDIQAGITTAAIETDSYLMQYRIDKAMLNMGYSGNASNFMDILYNASINDREAYEIIYADMVESGITEDKIRNAMETRMKRDQGVESVADLEARYLTPKQEQSYNSLRQRVTGTSVWSAASAEQREALEEDLYDLTVANSSGLKLQEKIDGGAAYGIDEADYLLYRLALHVVDQPSESGKLGSYTGDEVEAAIDMLTGLDDEARAYLWEAAGKSEKSNPYK